MILLFTATALLPILIVERYGVQSLLPNYPLTRLTAPLYLICVGVAAFMLVDFAWARQHTAFLSTADTQIRSQLLVWAPYALVWTLSTFLGAVAGVSDYAWVSLAIVLGVAVLRFPGFGSTSAITAALQLNRVLVVASLILALTHHGFAFAPYSTWPGGWWVDADRLQGLLPHPNTLGWVAAVAVAVEIFCARRGIRPVTVGLCVAALLLTGSRTASIALALGLALCLLYNLQRRSRTGSITAVGVGLVGLIGIIAVAMVSSVGVETFNGRSATWLAAARAFSDNWVLGSGPGAYLNADSTVAFVAYAHNQVLQTAAEMGIFGLLALGAHIYFLTVYVRKYANNSLGVTLVGMWLGMFVSENLLRFAAPTFAIQIVVFQVALFAAANLSKQRKTQ